MLDRLIIHERYPARSSSGHFCLTTFCAQAFNLRQYMLMHGVFLKVRTEMLNRTERLAKALKKPTSENKVYVQCGFFVR
jgi:hypothetical protein